jgi:hypothetical protein
LTNINKSFRFISESIEEIILLGIILLNILDFLEFINPDWDYVKKIISWSALIFLFYKANLTRLFFGISNKKFDFLIILSYFFLSFKNIIVYSSSALNELTHKGANYWAKLHPINQNSIPGKSEIINITSPLQNIDLNTLAQVPIKNSLNNLSRSFSFTSIFPPEINEFYVNIYNDISNVIYYIEPKFFIHRWHNFLIDNIFLFQKFSLLIGFFLIIFLSIYFTLKLNIIKPSIMNLIDEVGQPPKKISKILIRFLTIFVIINFFYIAVFNLTIEWLGIAVDAPLIIIAVFFYFFIWLKHHKRFNVESIVFKIGNIGEKFYENFINLFHTKKGLMLGISGMLVLHIITDIGNFIIPYTIGIFDPLYFHELGINHSPIFSIGDFLGNTQNSLFYIDILHTIGFFNKFYIGFLYSFNLLSIFLIFTGPAFLWYVLFKNNKINIPNITIGLFYSSLVCFLLASAFTIARINSQVIIGVDLLTNSIFETAFLSLSLIVFISIFCGFLTYILSFNDFFKPKLILGIILIVFFYFTKYIYLFFIDTWSYYLEIIIYNLQSGELLIGIYLLMFLTMTILFYVGGLFSYVYECFKN